MKKIMLLSSFLFYFVQSSIAQQKSYYTQYTLNNFIINPALAGIENYTDLKFSNRNQWVDLPGAPQTFYISIHKPIGKQDYKTSATSFLVPGENPRGKAYAEAYTASDPHHGIGLSVINDKTGNFNRLTSIVSYAYHIGINAKTNLSFGFSAGVNMVSLNTADQVFSNNITDPSVGNIIGELQKTKPDIAAGFWVYSANYFFGASAQQIIPQKLSFANNPSVKQDGYLIPHLFICGGVRLLASEDISITPSAMIKYINGAFVNNYQTEISVKFQYHDKLWIGGNARQFDGFAVMAGVNMSNFINFNYAYDINRTTTLGQFAKGSHELVIGFLLGNKYDDACPRNMW